MADAQPDRPLPPAWRKPPLRPVAVPIGGVATEQDAVGALDDSVLAIRASEGDEDAFAVLVRRHSSRLLALAQHLLGNRADAEDAVQDAFISAWRRLPEFRHSASFSTWMYRIVTNRCLNTLRRRPIRCPWTPSPNRLPWMRTAHHPRWPRRTRQQPP